MTSCYTHDIYMIPIYTYTHTLSMTYVHMYVCMRMYVRYVNVRYVSDIDSM